jgi:hypothetical protein
MEATRVLSYIIVVLVFGASLGGCASRPCRQPRAPELDQTVKQPATPSNPTSADSGSARNENAPLKVRVYQSDGSRQCERRGGKSVETTERELAGISVYHREKRSDGLMHIQVCGSPTGIINIYEIDSSNLKQAEERGFKRWEE